MLCNPILRIILKDPVLKILIMENLNPIKIMSEKIIQFWKFEEILYIYNLIQS